jgi:hypothetical protein
MNSCYNLVCHTLDLGKNIEDLKLLSEILVLKHVMA